MTNAEQNEDLTLTIPITSKFRAEAERFAAAQELPEKAERLHRNVLAMLAVAEYLRTFLGYEVALEESDGWNGATRSISNAADVVIAGLGRLECCPVVDGVCPVMPEVRQGRIGYLAVEIEARQVRLLGFVRPFPLNDPWEEIPLDELEDLDELVDYLTRLEAARKALEAGNLPQGEVLLERCESLLDRTAMVAQLERTYRQERRSRWRVRGAKALSGESALEELTTREIRSEEELLKLQDIAECLIEGLADLWNLSEEGRE